MSYNNILCSDCDSTLYIEIQKSEVLLKCTCRLNKTLSTVDYLNQLRSIPNSRSESMNRIEEYKMRLQKGKDFIKSYFTNLKNQFIQEMINKINSVEAEYEKCLQMNKHQLDLLEQMILKYNDTIEMNNNIKYNSCINTQTCKEKNFESILTYYKTFSILKPLDCALDKLKLIKKIDDHTERVNSLLILKDKRIASISGDLTIKVFSPSHNYHCDITLKGHTKNILYLTQMDNGLLVSNSDDGTIKIWSIEENNTGLLFSINAHERYIHKVIMLPNDQMVSCSSDLTIKVWKSTVPFSQLRVINNAHTDDITSIIYVKEKNFLISGSDDKQLKFWDLDFNNFFTMKDIHCWDTHSLYQLDKNRVIVGGIKKIIIVNIEKFYVENFIEDSRLVYVYSFALLRDRKNVLCGGYNGYFCMYDIESNKFEVKQTEHTQNINDLVLLDQRTIATCSKDKSIIIWNY